VNLNCPSLRVISISHITSIMDSLSKDQKDEMAVSMAILALYDGGVSFDDHIGL